MRTVPGAAVLCAALGLGVAGWLNARRLVVRRRTLQLPSWPERLSGLRIAVVSDLHAGRPHVRERHLSRVVARVNEAAPDLVVLLGDYVDAVIPGVEPLEPERVSAALGDLRARIGVVAVLGNHDWESDGARVAGALRSVGIRVLEDEAVGFDAGGRALWVAGLGDLRERGVAPERALARVPEGEPLLLLSHDPDPFAHLSGRPALVLAGHTHGGQINLPWFRRLVIPSRFGTRYASGHVVENDRHLYVSRGVGTSGLPLRFRAAPGVDLLELAAADGENAE
jgi:uncharacterized protein